MFTRYEVIYLKSDSASMLILKIYYNIYTIVASIMNSLYDSNIPSFRYKSLFVTRYLLFVHIELLLFTVIECASQMLS